MTLHNDEGVCLAHTDIFLDSPGTFVETLFYHETIDYTVTPGEQYTIEVIGLDFEGNIEQPHTPLAEFVLHWFYAGEIIGVIFLIMAVSWFCMIGAFCTVGVDEVKTWSTKRAGKVE